MLIFIPIGVIFVMLYQNQIKNDKKTELGISNDDIITESKYLCGHPEIDSPCLCLIARKDGLLEVYKDTTQDVGGNLQMIGSIKLSNIKDVSVDDSTTIEKRVGLKRLAVMGIFALAAKKKQVNELAYLTLNWNDGRFDHETIFEYIGPNSLQRANTGRNKLIRSMPEIEQSN